MSSCGRGAHGWTALLRGACGLPANFLGHPPIRRQDPFSFRRGSSLTDPRPSGGRTAPDLRLPERRALVLPLERGQGPGRSPADGMAAASSRAPAVSAAQVSGAPARLPANRRARSRPGCQRNSARSNAHLGPDAARRLCLPQCVVVAIVLVGVGLGERGHGAIKCIAGSEIGGDGDPVA